MVIDCLSETICRSLVRFRSSSACFLTRQHARHTLSARDGNGFAYPYCGTAGEPYR